MGEYTPTESDVREEWAYGAQDLDMDGNVVVSFDEALAQFDRFIARVKAEAVAGARKELVDLREENDRLERILQSPLSLKDLEVAWENAEQSGECREGDVLMTRHSDDNYEVWVSVGAFDIGKKSRILSRAPKREPWADLADVLRASLLSDETVERVAHGIHASHDRGWHFEAEDHAVQEEYRAMARAALAAAIGDEA